MSTLLTYTSKLYLCIIDLLNEDKSIAFAQYISYITQ